MNEDLEAITTEEKLQDWIELWSRLNSAYKPASQWYRDSRLRGNTSRDATHDFIVSSAANYCDLHQRGPNQ